jgi:hypothetical protein
MREGKGDNDDHTTHIECVDGVVELVEQAEALSLESMD